MSLSIGSWQMIWLGEKRSDIPADAGLCGGMRSGKRGLDPLGAQTFTVIRTPC